MCVKHFVIAAADRDQKMVQLTALVVIVRNNKLGDYVFFFSSRRRHTRFDCDWSSDVCSSDLEPERHRLVHGFVSSLGATPIAVDPVAHDRLVALTSHLPHALANLLLNQAGASRIEGHDPLEAAGGSLRDMTRVAGANPRIWVDIFLDNADALAAALAEHRRRVEQLESALAAGDAGFLARWIAEAPGNR